MPTILIRIASAAVAISVIALLLVAASLEPHAGGLGTHQALGLPPCSTRILFGIRCPMCGMTTSWAHFVRAEFPSAVMANLAGTILAVFAIAVALLSMQVSWRGTLPTPDRTRQFTLGLVAVITIAITEWGLRLSPAGDWIW
ncbi:DUF2752 domain-containing protein [Roseiconus lacunae]|uniref:DUF2752 domain-containing protein n=1 Tax=Roseiconus lacunae TaxID=2605694 RepID=UPI0011F3BDB6|nr:DUF2752 domain-containing protein [Roseiconus lacunae]